MAIIFSTLLAMGTTYPAVLLGLPLWAVLVDLSAWRAVGELEKAGEHAVYLCSVREDWVLEVHPMRDNVVVLIHPESTDTQTNFITFKLFAGPGVLCFICKFSIVWMSQARELQAKGF